MTSSEIILFRRDDSAMSVTALDLANDLQEVCLSLSSLIGTVETAQQQERAVHVQIELKAYLDAVEKSRKFVKQPVWDLGVKIDALANELSKDVKAEMMRVSTLVGDFQAREKEKVRALEAARLRDLEENERKRQAELAMASTPEKAQEVQEKFNAIAAALPTAFAARAEGQTVTPDWEIVISDRWLLARSHPTCVDIVARVSDIKSLLKAGVKVQGVIATPITKAGVRVPRGKTIDV